MLNEPSVLYLFLKIWDSAPQVFSTWSFVVLHHTRTLWLTERSLERKSVGLRINLTLFRTQIYYHLYVDRRIELFLRTRSFDYHFSNERNEKWRVSDRGGMLRTVQAALSHRNKSACTLRSTRWSPMPCYLARTSSSRWQRMPGRQLAHVLSNFRHCVVVAAAARSQRCERRSRLTTLVRSFTRRVSSPLCRCFIPSLPRYMSLFVLCRYTSQGLRPSSW